jgi:hypothetical protein
MRPTAGGGRDGTTGAQSTGHLAGGGVAAHHDVSMAALLEVRIEDRLAGRAPARLPLQRMESTQGPEIL